MSDAFTYYSVNKATFKWVKKIMGIALIIKRKEKVNLSTEYVRSDNIKMKLIFAHKSGSSSL